MKKKKFIPEGLFEKLPDVIIDRSNQPSPKKELLDYIITLGIVNEVQSQKPNTTIEKFTKQFMDIHSQKTDYQWGNRLHLTQKRLTRNDWFLQMGTQLMGIN